MSIFFVYVLSDFICILNCLNVCPVQPGGSVRGAGRSALALRVRRMLESTRLRRCRERREDRRLGQHRCYHNNCTTTQVATATHTLTQIFKQLCVELSVCVFVCLQPRSQPLSEQSFGVFGVYSSARRAGDHGELRQHTVIPQQGVCVCVCVSHCSVY